MTKVTAKGVAKKLKEIEAIKAKISEQRDQLREAVSDMGDILESVDNATSDIESGIEYLKSGLTEMSGYL